MRWIVVIAVKPLKPHWETAALGDVILVAGKGHETGQIIGEKIIPFSDHETLRDLAKTSDSWRG